MKDIGARNGSEALEVFVMVQKPRQFDSQVFARLGVSPEDVVALIARLSGRF